MNEATDQQPRPPSSGLSTGMAVGFYGVLVIMAWVLGGWWLDLDLIEWHNRWGTPLWLDVVLGLGLGGATVVASRIFEKTTEWARVLTEEFRKILGHLTPTQVLIFAVTSGIAEEVFFRGFLQQAITERLFDGDTVGMIAGLIVASIVFGIVHVGPDREKFLPWTIMALVLGFFFGAVYLYTGNIIAPVVAHFTINFLNLLHIARDADATPPDEGQPRLLPGDDDGQDTADDLI